MVWENGYFSGAMRQLWRYIVSVLPDLSEIFWRKRILEVLSDTHSILYRDGIHHGRRQSDGGMESAVSVSFDVSGAGFCDGREEGA